MERRSALARDGGVAAVATGAASLPNVWTLVLDSLLTTTELDPRGGGCAAGASGAVKVHEFE